MSQALKQKQKEKQVQRLLPQQMLMIRLLEMPVMTLKNKIENELIDNVALDEGEETRDERRETRDERDATRDAVLYDEYDDKEDGYRSDVDDYEISSTQSFLDDLTAQIADFDVSDHQRLLIEYLIGSLDERGYLDHSLKKIEDELVVYHNIDTNIQELEEALSILQQFDPAGIGARDLQECLSLQLRRIAEADVKNHLLLRIAQEIIDNHFDKISSPRVLSQTMKISYDDVEKARNIISKLNPSPGLSLNETAADRVKTVVPDFIITTSDQGDVTFVVNQAGMPQLRVNEEFMQQLAAYQQHEAKMTRQMKEAYQYTKEKIDYARIFINALRQRKYTLYATMKAIIDLQKPFMLSQNENDLKPMKLEDIAKVTGLDSSTICRVKSGKYALLDGTMYPLSSFFLRVRNNAQGEEISSVRVNRMIQTIIDSEDKKKPCSDLQIVVLLKEKGINISRRTVTKYRQKMGIPKASKRK